MKQSSRSASSHIFDEPGDFTDPVAVTAKGGTDLPREITQSGQLVKELGA